MSNAIQVSQTTAILSKKEIVDSRLYPNIKTTSQAAVVMAKAQSFGLCPTVMADNIFFVGGKPSLSAQLIATLVLKSGKYLFRVREKTAKQAVIEFFEILPDGKRDSLGTETFTMEMAQRANLTTNPSWKKFPEAMLWARCLTAGVRARCPDALGGTPAYSIEEMNPKIEVDEDGIPIPDAEVSEAALPGVSDKLRELMSLTKTPEKKLLKHYSVESLEDLSAEQQADAISVLESKLAAN